MSFEYAGTTRAIVANQDGSLNGPANPEARGNVIVAYLTGQGAVNPPVPTGQPRSERCFIPRRGGYKRIARRRDCQLFNSWGLPRR